VGAYVGRKRYVSNAFTRPAVDLPVHIAKTVVGFPGFPVEIVGVGEVHAAFLNESRTRGHFQRSVQKIRVGLAPHRTRSAARL